MSDEEISRALGRMARSIAPGDTANREVRRAIRRRRNRRVAVASSIGVLAIVSGGTAVVAAINGDRPAGPASSPSAPDSTASCTALLDGQTYTKVINSTAVTGQALQEWLTFPEVRLRAPSEIQDISPAERITVCQMASPTIEKGPPPTPGQQQPSDRPSEQKTSSIVLIDTNGRVTDLLISGPDNGISDLMRLLP